MSLYLLVYTSFAGNNMGLMVHVFCLAISTVRTSKEIHKLIMEDLKKNVYNA